MKGVRPVEVFDEEAGLAFSVSSESGGELSSLRVRRDNRWVELLHRANLFQPPLRGWRGRAPWLFPAVGRSRRGKRLGCCAFQGQVYPMPMHGFVKDIPWTLVSCDRRSVVCRTESDAATRKSYPFDFELTVVHSLLPDGVSSRVEVLAAPSNQSVMPFCLGSHLSFSLPFGGGAPGDVSVRTPASRNLLLCEDGFLTGKSEPAPYGKGAVLRDDPRLADMVLADFPPGDCWVEVRGASGLGVRVSQAVAGDPGPLRFVLYADPARAFFCPEPWHGEPDSLNTGRALARLAPGERFDWEMTVAVL